MTLQEGDFVIHQQLPEWGKGKILEIVGNNRRIFFEYAGEKMMASSATLEKIEVEIEHPILSKVTAETNFSKFKTPEELVNNFLELFPDGFEDYEYFEEERNYKVDASDFTKEKLAEKRLKKFLEMDDYESVVTSAKQCLNKANLVFPNEKMALSDGLSLHPDNKKRFSESLYYHLYSSDSLSKRFNHFSQTLKNIDAAKWTTATYYLHFCFPDKYPFMKPEVTKNAAAAFGYPLNYSSEVEWETYSRLIEFVNFVGKQISSHKLLQPRDMIDLQGLIWCADPSKYDAKYRRTLEARRKKRLLENKKLRKKD